MLVGDFLGAVLVDGVVVTGDERIVVAEPDLLLAVVALALDGLEPQTGPLHTQPDIAQQRVHSRRRQDRVVDVVIAGRGQPVVAGCPRLAIGLVEHDELQLGGDVGGQSALGQPVQLAAQDGARCHADRAAVGPAQIGDRQRRAGQPGNQPQGAQVRRHHHVAVAGVPTRHRIAGHGVHFDVDGQQVATTLRPVSGHLVDEEPGGHPLAHEPSLHVGESHDDGIHIADPDELFQRGQRQGRRTRTGFLVTHDPLVNQAFTRCWCATRSRRPTARSTLAHCAGRADPPCGTRSTRSAGCCGPPSGWPAS